MTTWSRDGRYLFAQRSNAGRTDASIYRIDTTSGRTEELTPHDGRIYYDGAASVSPNGATLLIGSNEKQGFSNVALLDIASRKLTWVTDLQWDAQPGGFSPTGDRFTYTVNEDGRTELYLVERSSMRTAKIDFPLGMSSFDGNPVSFSPSGDRLIVTHQSSQQPPDLWIYDISAGTAKQLTFSALAGLDPERIPPSQLVHYRSFDGKIVSAFVWIPDKIRRDGSNPGIVLPHGGPTSQTLDSFNRTLIALGSRGYVCIAPNVRGSTGYGIEFQQANHQDLGGGDLQDVYAARFLMETGYVNPRKMGITGGSYGGYMTLMAIGKTSDLWAAAVEQYGIINWFTMLQHEDARLQAYQKSLLGDPVTDRRVYEDDSPITFIRKAKAPLLVLQGDNDIRVPKEEAMQVVDILEKAGVVGRSSLLPK